MITRYESSLLIMNHHYLQRIIITHHESYLGNVEGRAETCVFEARHQTYNVFLQAVHINVSFCDAFLKVKLTKCDTVEHNLWISKFYDGKC